MRLAASKGVPGCLMASRGVPGPGSFSGPRCWAFYSGRPGAFLGISESVSSSDSRPNNVFLCLVIVERAPRHGWASVWGPGGRLVDEEMSPPLEVGEGVQFVGNVVFHLHILDPEAST